MTFRCCVTIDWDQAVRLRNIPTALHGWVPACPCCGNPMKPGSA